MSARSEAWDVIVVGGGPAGSATAARLAARGHRTILLDRDEFPRRKPCGDCVSPAALREITELGAAGRVLREPHSPLAGWRIRAPGGDGFEGRFPSDSRGLGIAREKLDLALLEHAEGIGAVVRTGVKVTDLLRERGAVCGVRGVAGGKDWEMRARLVVGADGLRSVVLRRLHLLRRPPRLWKIALTARLRGVADLSRAGELHVRSWGCIGIAPIGPGEANVTVVVNGRGAPRVSAGREQYFDSAVAELSTIRSGSRVGEVLATGPFDWAVGAAVSDGALLVGDSAGYYDPFTGQGIYRALRGAALAAGAADLALRAGDVTAHGLRAYEAARRRTFGPGERLQRVIEFFVARPRLLAGAVAGLRRRPGLADALISATGDIAPVRTLCDPRHLLVSRL